VRSYKVYNCKQSRDLNLVTCSMRGNFEYPSSAVARLAECTGTRAWIEKSDKDVTAELMATASSQIKEKFAEHILAHDMKYGRALRGAKS
jgi:hypothetical protein